MANKNLPMGGPNKKGTYPSQNIAGEADQVRGSEIPANIAQGEAKPQPGLGWQDKGRMSHEGEGDAGGTWGKDKKHNPY